MQSGMQQVERTMITLIVSWAITLPALSGPAAAQDLQGWQLHWENDAFTQGGKDQWYTNGLRASWSWNRPGTTFLGQGLDSAARWWLPEGPAPTLTYAFGQSMYSPADISVAGPQPFDRPWGAFLFTGVTAHAYARKQFRATEIKLGITGPHALGEQAQAGVHKHLTGSQPPRGWDQQLRSRLGLQLSHTRVDRFGDSEQRDFFGFQLSGGMALGTLRTYAHVGLAMTVGDLGGSNSPMSLANEGDFVIQDFDNRAQFKKPFGFVAVSATAMAYNYFLQGPTPYGRSQIDKRPLYGALQVGVSLPLHVWFDSRNVPRVVYSHTARQQEFTSRLPGARKTNTAYGGFTFVWDLQP
jgi:lipid A 3-O-deacylase